MDMDPEVVKLRKLLEALQRDVKDGLTTQAEASALLGKMAEAMASRRGKETRWRRNML